MAPSCLQHFLELDELALHINEHEYHPRGTKRNELVDENIADHAQKKIHTNTPSNCALVPTRNGMLCFMPASNNIFDPDRPKLTTDTITDLEAQLTIIAPYNSTLSTEKMSMIKQEQSAQMSLASLKRFPAAHKFLLDILRIENYTEWAPYIWRHTVEATSSDLEQKFINAIRFILTAFADKCHRHQSYQPKSERTYWIDRMVHIFQTFGDQTHLLGFEWCKTSLNDLRDSALDLDIWKQTSRRFLDGLGYNQNNNEQLTMEASSGQHAEDITHTIDDTLKNIHSTISMIDSIVRRNLDAKFSTVTCTRTFCVQSVRKTITLSTTYLDPEEIGCYIHQEIRHAEIPVSFEERDQWLRVFELLATLAAMLDKQTEVSATLHKERNGVIEVPFEESTRSKLYA